MLNKEQKLVKNIFLKDVEQKATRDGYGEGLVEAGEKDERVVVLCSDVTESTRSHFFKEKFPERFIEVGVSEQVLATVASGMANYGKIPFISAYAVFSPGRNWEQIRTTICLNNVPVKIGGGHAGLTVGGDGATHQALEDIALMRVLPNMVVIVPADSIEAKKAVLAVAKTTKPTYIRFERQASAVITTEKSPFKIGKAEVLWNSRNPQATVIACGSLVYEALLAAKELEKKGIEAIVINNHTIKPIDEQTIIRSAKTTGAIVTVENHQVSGGLGSAVSEVLAKNYPVPIEFVGVNDKFGESGKSEELLKKHNLTKEGIIEAVKKVIARKKTE